MRQLLAILVLFNLLFFLWNYIFPYTDALHAEYTTSELSITLKPVDPPPDHQIPGRDSDNASSRAGDPSPNDSSVGSIPDTQDPVTRASSSQTAAQSQPYVCGSIGPMATAEEQTNVMSILSLETGAELSVRIDKNKRDVSYWVLIPPLPSLAVTREHMKLLSKNGLNESFIVTEPSNRNAISLGVFRDQRKAQSLHNQVKALNLPTPPKIIKRGSHDYWVEFKVELSNRYFKTIDQLLRSKKHLQHIERDCS